MTEKILNQLYNTPGTGTHLAGESTLLIEAQKKDPTITRDDVLKFLNSKKVYQLTNETNKRAKKLFPKAVTTRPNALMHCDLAFWAKNSIVYLVCRDTFSSMTYAQFMGKGKGAQRTLNAFKKIEERVKGGRISHVSFDSGTEFSLVSKYMRDTGRKATKLSSWQHAYCAEAAIKDIRMQYRKIKAQNDGKGDIRKLMPSIISTINNKPSRITGMKPVEAALPQNWWTVFTRKFDPYLQKIKETNYDTEPKYKPGDTVKILNLKSASERNAMKKPETTYSETNFTINRVLRQSYPISYKLSDPDGTEINRSFYERHLFKVPSE